MRGSASRDHSPLPKKGTLPSPSCSLSIQGSQPNVPRQPFVHVFSAAGTRFENREGRPQVHQSFTNTGALVASKLVAGTSTFRFVNTGALQVSPAAIFKLCFRIDLYSNKAKLDNEHDDENENDSEKRIPPPPPNAERRTFFNPFPSVAAN